MACAVEEDFSKFDSCALSACASEASCSAADWDGEACSKPCAPSRSHFSMSACSSSCGPAFPGPALKATICWADYEDDRTTNASPRSTRSLCDEAAEDEPADNEQSTRHARVDWADMVDSEDEDEAWPSVDGDAEPATSVGQPDNGEGGEMPAAAEPSVEEKEVAEPRPARSSRASRRARARAATAPAAAQPREEAVASEKIRRGLRDDAREADGCADRQAPAGKRSQPSRTQPKADKDAWSGHTDERKGAAKGASKGAGKNGGKGSSRALGKGFGKASGKGASKGASESAGKGGGKGAGSEKYQCQIYLGIEEDSKFRVVRRLIGSGGENMKNINRETGAKLRLRGKGSKFLEGDEQEEANCELMLCISAQEKPGYDAAKATACDLIEGIHRSYRAFCHKAGKHCPVLELDVHEGYRQGSR